MCRHGLDDIQNFAKKNESFRNSAFKQIHLYFILFNLHADKFANVYKVTWKFLRKNNDEHRKKEKKSIFYVHICDILMAKKK